MKVDEIRCKFPRMTNGKGRDESAKMVKIDDEDEEGEHKRGGGAATNGFDLGSSGVGRYYGGWPSSRIVRVSRASGGKDRHSKVLTSKGLRDRRVRLSVNTAIQFYDLQDRLGYDQPSKAVEWLLKAAASSISELPPMTNPFPDTPKQLSYEKLSSSDQVGLESVEVDMKYGDPSYHHNQQNQQNVTKSCSSNSENSKGPGLSLSRSENRMKARERAKERAMEKEKEKENESPHAGSLNPISQTTSFTELLNEGISNSQSNSNSPRNGTTNEFFQKSQAQWTSTPMDYFTTGLLGPMMSRPGPMQLPETPLFSVAAEHHQELQHFSFVPDHHLLYGNNNGSTEYNLNFLISSSGNNSSGFNRGTLQSNLPHFQRFSPHIDGSPPSFLIGAVAPVDNHNQFFSGFDGRLHLSYGDSAARHRGKGKN